MAAAIDIEGESDKILTCSICLETYKIPKFLPCLHTFCEGCIDKQIKSVVTNERESYGFKCPVCRQLVSLYDKYGRSNTWAKKLPKNDLLATIIERNKIKLTTRLCEPCLIDDKEKNATCWCAVCREVYCSTCEKDHRKFKMSANHKIVSLKDLLSDETFQSYTTSFVACTEHPCESVKVFCKDHLHPCCTLCAAINHRICQDVVKVEDVTSGIKESKLAKDTIESLRALSFHLEEDFGQKNNNYQTVKTNEKKIQEKIKEFEESIMSIAEYVRNIGLNSYLVTVQKDTEGRLLGESTELSSLKGSVDSCIQTLEVGLKHGSELQFLVELNKLVKRKAELESRIIRSIRKMMNVEVVFEPNEVLRSIQKAVKKIAVIGLKEDNFDSRVSKLIECKETPQPANIQSGKLNIVYSFNFDDEQETLKTSSGILMGDIVLLADSGNWKIVKYNIRGIFMADLKIPENPYVITEIENPTVAV